MSTETPNEPNHIKWGLFYYDPADPRIWVPQTTSGMRGTINFANKISWVIAAGIVALIVWAICSGQAHVNMP